MLVKIQTKLGTFLETIEETATIFDLKKKVYHDKDKRIPLSYIAHFVGNPISDENKLVKEFLGLGSGTFTLLPAEDEDESNMQGPKSINPTSGARDVFLITGSPMDDLFRDFHPSCKPTTKDNIGLLSTGSSMKDIQQDFQCLKLFPGTSINATLEYSQFGIAYQRDEECFDVEIFNTNKAWGKVKIECKPGSADNRVILKPEQTEENPTELFSVLRTYKENTENNFVGFTPRLKLVALALGDLKISDEKILQEKTFKKTYQCKIDMGFPETENTQKYLKESIEEIVLNSTHSAVDLDFVKHIILEEYAEEILSFEFEDLELQHLPWSSVIFEVVDIQKGSVKLEFNLEFKNPINESDLYTNRIIELVVLTIIENLQFIKSIKESKIEKRKENLVLFANIKADKFDEDLLKTTMISLRGNLKYISGKEEGGKSPSEDDVVIFLLDFLRDKKKEVETIMMKEFSPKSMRSIAKVILDSKITDKDFAKIKFQIDTTAKKNKIKLLKITEESCWLFPWDFRKLSDLEPQIFSKVVKLTRDLPMDKKLLDMYFISNLDAYEDVKQQIQLSKVSNTNWPYREILDDYRDNGGTIGGLLKAFEKFMDEVLEEKDKIKHFIEQIEIMRTELYENILNNVIIQSHSQSVLNIEQFEKTSREKGLRVKTNQIESFDTLKQHLIPGDQVWIFRKPSFMRSYAHVTIFIDDNKYVHINAPNIKLKMKATAIVKEDNIDTLKEEKWCFAVRQECPLGKDPDIFSRRAQSCLGITFDYDPENANCESFCNGVHGKWFNVQGQDIRGSGKKMANTGVKFLHFLKKKEEDNLATKMMNIFQQKKLVLEDE